MRRRGFVPVDVVAVRGMAAPRLDNTCHSLATGSTLEKKRGNPHGTYDVFSRFVVLVGTFYSLERILPEWRDRSRCCCCCTFHRPILVPRTGTRSRPFTGINEYRYARRHKDCFAEQIITWESIDVVGRTKPALPSMMASTRHVKSSILRLVL